MIRETKVEGQSDSLADRVSRRLGNDGDLSTRQAARRSAWRSARSRRSGTTATSRSASLWGLYCQYPYMPRLRDRKVLDEGIVDMPMIWQTDAFALATGLRRGCRPLHRPLDSGRPRQALRRTTDSLLLVRPDVASKQREAEIGSVADSDDKRSEPRDVPLVQPAPTRHRFPSRRPASTGSRL